MTTPKLVVLAIAALVGCAEPAEQTVISANVSTFADEALPVLEAACVSCHDGSRPDIGFLAGDTPAKVRHTLLDSTAIDLDAPVQSRLLTKGPHEGPGFTAVEVDAVLGWLESEHHP